MIARQGDFPEHASVPALKVIDFGMAEQVEEGIANTANLYWVARAMIELMTSQSSMLTISTYKGIATRATEILPDGNGHLSPALDPELRDFLALCLAADARYRPSLAVALQTAEAGTAKVAESYGPYVRRETDEHIAMVLQILIYDSETEEPTVDIDEILSADQDREG